MKYFISLIVAIVVLFTSCEQSSTEHKKENIAEQYKQEFLDSLNLDKRTVLFEVDKNKFAFTGTAQTEKLKDEFSSFLRRKDKNFSNQLVVAEPQIAFISNSVTNVRSEPKHSAELSTQYLLGQKVKIYNTLENKEWYYIQGIDNYLGWVDHGGILLANETSEEFKNAPKHQLQTNELVAKTTTNEVCCDLVFGDILGKISANTYVLPSGEKVAINDSNFTPPNTQNKIDLAVAKAESLMGRPYLWGGTSVKAMDCSGFTRMAFLNSNYLLGRDASLQVKEGKEIDKNDQSKWQKGDLLFFGNLREDGSERITHVAIHLEDGRFIHASQKVRKESLNPQHKDYNKHRAETLMHVKRIFE